jgi:hypothetical protein
MNAPAQYRRRIFVNPPANSSLSLIKVGRVYIEE